MNEFNKSSLKSHFIMQDDSSIPLDEYTTSMRSITIYNPRSDQLIHISLEEAIQECECFFHDFYYPLWPLTIQGASILRPYENWKNLFEITGCLERFLYGLYMKKDLLPIFLKLIQSPPLNPSNAIIIHTYLRLSDRSILPDYDFECHIQNNHYFKNRVLNSQKQQHIIYPLWYLILMQLLQLTPICDGRLIAFCLEYDLVCPLTIVGIQQTNINV